MSTPETTFSMLANLIKPLLPKSWHFVGYEDAVDDPDRVTVVVKLRTIERLPSAPAGGYLVEWVVSITAPNTDPGKADPALFDAVLGLVDDLDGIPWLRWSTAQKVLDNDRFAFDITIQTTTTKGV